MSEKREGERKEREGRRQEGKNEIFWMVH